MNPDRILQDKDVWSLGPTDSTPKGEFIINDTSDGRIGLRLIDRVGNGVLFIDEEITRLKELCIAAENTQAAFRASLGCPNCGKSCGDECPLD